MILGEKMTEENQGLTTRTRKLNKVGRIGLGIYASCCAGMIGRMFYFANETGQYNQNNPSLNMPPIVRSVNASQNRISQLESQLTELNPVDFPQEYIDANSRVLGEISNQVSILQRHISDSTTNAEYVAYQKRLEEFKQGENYLFSKQLKGLGILVLGAIPGLLMLAYGRKNQ
jgi:hypothetical protein